MLLIASITDKTEVMISESDIVEYADPDILLASDRLKNNGE